MIIKATAIATTTTVPAAKLERKLVTEDVILNSVLF
jgi:hypothetical protein